MTMRKQRNHILRQYAISHFRAICHVIIELVSQSQKKAKSTRTGESHLGI